MNVYISLYSVFIFPPFIMKKQDAIRLRKQVQDCKKKGMPVAKIAQKLGVSRPFVYLWMDAQTTEDQRGWKKGRKRKYTDEQETKIVEKRKELSDKFFSEERQSGKNSKRSSSH